MLGVGMGGVHGGDELEGVLGVGSEQVGGSGLELLGPVGGDDR